ncbi:MAG: hypothetical protein II482_00280 [Lachnospiraceae bacterium]|nr:hypothetical protein [Lachnospiraceae bacterium]
MENIVYTATLNDRHIFRAGSLAKIKSTASRIANRNFRWSDRMVVTGRADGALVMKTVYTRSNGSWDKRGQWMEMSA